MSVLAELKNLTSERYVVSIDADTTVYEDDYEEGEGDCVNMWKNKETHLTTTSDELSVDLSKALKEYIEDELNIDYDKANIKQLFDDFDDCPPVFEYTSVSSTRIFILSFFDNT